MPRPRRYTSRQIHAGAWSAGLLILLAIFLVTPSVYCQDAAPDGLRERLKNVPDLPLKAIEVGVSPSIVLTGISAKTSAWFWM